MKNLLTADQVRSAAGLEGWQVVDQRLQADFATGSFDEGVRLIQRIAALADDAHHHPDIQLTYPRVRVELTTHDVGGLTTKDVDLARAIKDTAQAAGIAIVPAA